MPGFFMSGVWACPEDMGIVRGDLTSSAGGAPGADVGYVALQLDVMLEQGKVFIAPMARHDDSCVGLT
jgi:hypothetical protein